MGEEHEMDGSRAGNDMPIELIVVGEDESDRQWLLVQGSDAAFPRGTQQCSSVRVEPIALFQSFDGRSKRIIDRVEAAGRNQPLDEAGRFIRQGDVIDLGHAGFGSTKLTKFCQKGPLPTTSLPRVLPS